MQYLRLLGLDCICMYHRQRAVKRQCHPRVTVSVHGCQPLPACALQPSWCRNKARSCTLDMEPVVCEVARCYCTNCSLDLATAVVFSWCACVTSHRPNSLLQRAQMKSRPLASERAFSFARAVMAPFGTRHPQAKCQVQAFVQTRVQTQRHNV